MRVGYASCCVLVGGVVWVFAAGCASQGSEAAPAPASVASAKSNGTESGGRVLIQVEADCKVDIEEAHISESKNEEAYWQLNGDPGPLAIEFKEERGRNALHVAAMSSTAVTARIKLAKQQGRHPYRIKIGEKECPDPSIIIDG